MMSFFKTSPIKVVSIVIISIFVTLFVFSDIMIKDGDVLLTPLETIDGIPYSHDGARVLVDETLAHSDVLLNASRFGKTLYLTIRFLPGSADTLAVAVRENSFWFSYQPVIFYDRQQAGAAIEGEIEKTVTFPLTDKIQSDDQSLDVMFFARNKTNLPDPALERSQNTISWQLQSITGKQQSEIISWREFKQFSKRFLTRERPI